MAEVLGEGRVTNDVTCCVTVLAICLAGIRVRSIMVLLGLLTCEVVVVDALYKFASH